MPITVENSAAIRSKGLETRRQMGPTPFERAVELQNLLMDDARKEDLKPIVRAGIARAFKELEELKLRIKMKPAPKPIDVQLHSRSKAKPKATFLESPAQPKP